jgi:hypothetical protein
MIEHLGEDTLSAAEQLLVGELKTIDILINNADSFFRQSELRTGVDPTTLYGLMEMHGRENTRRVEEAYTKFRAAKG